LTFIRWCLFWYFDRCSAYIRCLCSAVSLLPGFVPIVQRPDLLLIIYLLFKKKNNKLYACKIKIYYKLVFGTKCKSTYLICCIDYLLYVIRENYFIFLSCHVTSSQQPCSQSILALNAIMYFFFFLVFKMPLCIFDFNVFFSQVFK
jgi:hypothetical protein